MRSLLTNTIVDYISCYFLVEFNESVCFPAQRRTDNPGEALQNQEDQGEQMGK